MPYVPMSADKFRKEIQFKRIHQRIFNFLLLFPSGIRENILQLLKNKNYDELRKLVGSYPDLECLIVILSAQTNFLFWSLKKYTDLKDAFDPFDGTYEFE